MPDILLVADDAGGAVAGVLETATPATLLALGRAADEIATATPAAITEVIGLPALDWSVPTDALGAALRSLLAGARLVVIESSQPGRDLAGWLVGATGATLVWAVDAIRVDVGIAGLELDRVVQGGSHRMVHGVADGSMTIALVKPPSAAPPRPAGAGLPASRTRRDVGAGPSLVSAGTTGDATAPGVALRGARVVVSVGRGIGGAENVATFEQLAGRLGAALGASRVAVDAGWVPFARQVGQTGVTVSPDVYIAFGISGAIQHLAGMRASGTVIAVNTDPDAPLCQLADLVVAGDAVEVAEGILKRLAERG